MKFGEIGKDLKKFWNFIWNDDSLLSWVLNIIIAFVLVKFIIYPGLGLLLGTTHPVVAVVSGSMEHNGYTFNSWWEMNKGAYKQFNITKSDFGNYSLINGFNKGDLMVLGSAKNIKKGDVLVFVGSGGEAIIHRVVSYQNLDGKIFVQTKGDNNPGSRFDEINITNDRFIGKTKFKIPYLGWFKLLFLKILGQG